MKKLRSISIVFPAYNDSQTIPSLIKKALALGPRISTSFEIIVVNDGSTDSTNAVLTRLATKHTQLTIVQHSRNKGYGAALRSGFQTATKEWVFYTDGDGQYDPDELPALIEKQKEGVDVVNGYKIARADGIVRKIIGYCYNQLLHRIYPISISDIDCDFRLIRTSLLKKVLLTSQSGTICLELILNLQKAGAHFAEAAVHHYPRRHGSSQFFHPSHLIKTFTENLLFFIKWHRLD